MAPILQSKSLPGQAAMPWHAIPAEAVLDAVGSSLSGLTAMEASNRRNRFGPNELPRPQPTSLGTIYLRQFASPLIYLLLAAAAVSFALGKHTDAIFIFAVLQLNALIGTIQEWRAETGMRGLDRMIRNWTVATRDGRRERIPSEDLVPGDVVLAEQGMRVSADIRLLGASGLRLDESLLTGESYPVEKDAARSLSAATALADRSTMLYAGTTVVGGEGHGVVVATGAGTEIGGIAASLSQRGGEPPLLLRLRRFMNRLMIAFSVAVGLMVALELARGAAMEDIFLVAIALAVSAVPEGLPVAITVALAIGTRRMAAEKVIVRRLPAVEGLGACTLIASDKTGTLTCNVLTATRAWVPQFGTFEITGAGYQPAGEIRVDGRTPDPVQARLLASLATTGTLCNEGGYHVVDERTTHYGDSVDVALLVLAKKLGIAQDSLRARYTRVGIVPFAPERRYAASLDLVDGAIIAHVKGAAEVVLPMCANVDDGAVIAEERRLAAEGYRLLALASGPVRTEQDAALTAPEPIEDALCGLAFQGLVAFTDPLRPETADAVARCRSAGIDVRVVTGDHPITALAIARELGLVRADGTSDLVATGAELARSADDPSALGRLCANAKVFARVEPSQKLLIVEALQRQGHFVAVTGDGVNDAPALRSANIGVAMGLSGTDVARDAADLVISDDRFASIVSGIREGRIVYDNVRKVVNLLITTGAAEIVVFILALAAGLPLPLFAAQLLWLNLVTNGIQDVALSFERGEPDVLARPPRPPSQRLLDGAMAAQVALAGGFMGVAAFVFYALALAYGATEGEARNLLLLLVVLFENVHVFNCRSETRSVFSVPLSANPFVALSVVGALGIHVAAMHVPLMQQVLRVEPIPIGQWLVVIAMALSLLAVMEAYKFWVRSRR